MVEQVVDVFRQFDTRGQGTVTRAEFLQVLSHLDGSIWGDAQGDTLLQAYGIDENTKIQYEQLIKWIMGAPDGPLNGDPVCQAAYEGSLLTLKEHSTAGISRALGYVQEGGEIAGMWTMIPNTFQLKAVREDPTILPANALQWAAFGGHAHVVKFLTLECGMKRDDPSTFGTPSTTIASSHRLRLEGDVVEDDGEARHLLECEEHAGHAEELLKRVKTRPELGGCDTAQ